MYTFNLTKILYFNFKNDTFLKVYLYRFSYPLNATRDSNMRIQSIHLISLQTALTLLHKLKIVTREEIDNAFKKNEFLKDSVMMDMWVSIFNI